MGILGLHDADAIGQEKVTASHAGGYDSHPAIELVSVADIDAEKLATFGDAWEIPAERRYDDHHEMLATESLDVVSVCTPTMFHRDHVLDAVNVGDPAVVWCEKPIAASVANAHEMIDACEESGTELVINHSFRFCPKHVRLRELVREESLLGTVHSVSVQFRMELIRNSTHALDTLWYLLDGEPTRVSGYITGENEAAAALGATESVVDAGGGGYVVLDSGTFAMIDCTIPRADSSMSYQFIGDAGKLYLNNDDGEWRYWQLDDGTHVEAPLPDLDGSWSWTEDYAAAFPGAVEHIVDILEGRASNRSTGSEATKSLEVIVGWYLSHYTNGTVELPLDDALRTLTISSW